MIASSSTDRTLDLGFAGRRPNWVSGNNPPPLCRQYRKLARMGKPPTVVTAAIARELAGFVWAIAKQAQPSHAYTLMLAEQSQGGQIVQTHIQSWTRLEA
jgi:hypothetical protein